MSSTSSGVNPADVEAVEVGLSEPVGRIDIWDHFLNTQGHHLYKLKPPFPTSSASLGDPYVLFIPQVEGHLNHPVTAFLIKLTEFDVLRQNPGTVERPRTFRSLANATILVKNLDGTDRNQDMRKVLEPFRTGFRFKENTITFQKIFEWSAENPGSITPVPDVWARGPDVPGPRGPTKTWVLSKKGVLDTPADVVYVKLRADDAFTNQLLLGDGEAARAGRLYIDGVFIPEQTIVTLSSKTNTPPTHRYLRFRNKYGDPVDIHLPPHNWEPGKWDAAHKAAVREQRNWSSRCRNIKGVTLLFVLKQVNPISKSVIPLGQFAQMVQEIIAESAAASPIQQDFKVVLDNSPEFRIEKETFNYKLSECPFLCYDTYIQEAVYAAFLSKYPDEPWPDTEDKVKGMVKGVKQDGTNADAVQIQSRFVGSDTVIAAGVPGARDQLKTQQELMGISATQGAIACGWDAPRDRLEGATVDVPHIANLTFDSPGTYKAEWCHRIGLAFGHVGGYYLGHTISNIVFGTSACNSLMTRFERALQILLKYERDVREYRRKLGLPYSGEKDKFDINCSFELKTINTLKSECEDKPILSRKATADWKIETVVATPDQLTAFENWAKKYPQISFCLIYQYDLPKSYLLGTTQNAKTFQCKTAFYPFQSGFFTRLEAEVDRKLLQVLKSWSIQLADIEYENAAGDAKGTQANAGVPASDNDGGDVNMVNNAGGDANMVDDLARKLEKVSIKG